MWIIVVVTFQNKPTQKSTCRCKKMPPARAGYKPRSLYTARNGSAYVNDVQTRFNQIPLAYVCLIQTPSPPPLFLPQSQNSTPKKPPHHHSHLIHAVRTTG